ncbi:MAG: hypothetical protein NTU72_00640 [Fimbriimonadales bacterium]|nr:hypothetical protein [Fimbriimonadales bacterium]
MRIALAILWFVASLLKAMSLGDAGSYVTYLFPSIKGALAIALVSTVCVAEFVLAVCWIRKPKDVAPNFQLFLSAAFFGVHVLRKIEGLGAPCSCLGKWLSISPETGMLLTACLFLVSLVPNLLKEKKHVKST